MDLNILGALLLVTSVSGRSTGYGVEKSWPPVTVEEVVDVSPTTGVPQTPPRATTTAIVTTIEPTTTTQEPELCPPQTLDGHSKDCRYATGIDSGTGCPVYNLVCDEPSTTTKATATTVRLTRPTPPPVIETRPPSPPPPPVGDPCLQQICMEDELCSVVNGEAVCIEGAVPPENPCLNKRCGPTEVCIADTTSGQPACKPTKPTDVEKIPKVLPNIDPGYPQVDPTKPPPPTTEQTTHVDPMEPSPPTTTPYRPPTTTPHVDPTEPSPPTTRWTPPPTTRHVPPVTEPTTQGYGAGKPVDTAELVDTSPVGGQIALGEGRDLHPSCCGWAARGECDLNPFWMKINCQVSCGSAGCSVANAHECPTRLNIESCATGKDGPSVAGPVLPKEKPGCMNNDEFCNFWATVGECQKNSAYMHQSCRAACGIC